MTKQGGTHNSPAVPQGTGAPEITQVMLAAGVHMIAEEYGVCGADIAPDLARDVFMAMWAAKHDQEPSYLKEIRDSLHQLVVGSRYKANNRC